MTMEILTAVGVWTDISNDVRQSSGITITRGRSDEQSQAQPQRMSFTLDNRAGKFSLRNPLSPLYGKIGRNTPVRCTIDSGAFQRFYGVIPSWPPNWDPSHADHNIAIEAAGILRRLSQGQPVVSTSLKDFTLGQSPVYLQSLGAYYPLDGGSETITSPNLAPSKNGSFRGVADSSNPAFTYGQEMPAWIGTGMELNETTSASYMEGTVGLLSPSAALDFVWNSAGLGVLQPQFTDYNGQTWLVTMNTSADAGTLQVVSTDSDGVSTVFTATGVIPELQDANLHHFRLLINSPSIDTDYTVYIDGNVVDSGTLVGTSVSGCKHTRFHYTRYTNQTVVNLAHVTVWVGATVGFIPPVAGVAAAALGYVGETAIDRLVRVCGDGDIPIVTVGTAADSAPMGPQFSESRLDQIRDCETTDMGFLLEQRDADGLLYLAINSLYNQTAQFTLDYSLGQVSPPLDPVDDDQVTRNDVTATRRSGGSARYTVDSGPLSTLDPPNGVGRYDTDVTVNTETDDQLNSVASWIAGIGTLDKTRWPAVTVNLSAPGVGAALRNLIKAADIGDRFVITKMNKAFVYDDVSLIIIGYTEVIDPFMHTITFNCMPAEPYEVFEVESTGSRISSGETSLTNATMTTTATSMSVLSADATTLWTTAGGDMPISIMVAGEEMSVTAISGTTPGSAQTFTVTRSVNGVVKTHATGEVVRLKRRAVWAL